MPVSARFLTVALILLSAVALPGCRKQPTRVEEGIASYYGDRFHGRTTASGEAYDKQGLTAAHRTLPFGTGVKVTNLDNNRSVHVVITDRGPYVGGRIIDLSEAAARELGITEDDGVAPVRLEIYD